MVSTGGGGADETDASTGQQIFIHFSHRTHHQRIGIRQRITRDRAAGTACTSQTTEQFSRVRHIFINQIFTCCSDDLRLILAGKECATESGPAKAFGRAAGNLLKHDDKRRGRAVSHLQRDVLHGFALFKQRNGMQETQALAPLTE